MHQPTRRSLRGFLISALAAAAIAVSGSGALAATQLSHSGTPGAWGLPDSAADPAATCVYGTGGGTAGGTYLTAIRLRNAVELWGTSSSLRSVGYRPLVQHLQGGVWTTVKKGVLKTGNASLSHPVTLTGSTVTFGPLTQPKNPFRLALKLIWYAADASVAGTRVILVDSYVRRDGGVGGHCSGFVSDVHP